MVDRLITSEHVEARAFLDGAVKVRYFDSIAEADAWIVGLRARHAGVAQQLTEHHTTLTVSTVRPRTAEVDHVRLLDEAREAADRD